MCQCSARPVQPSDEIEDVDEDSSLIEHSTVKDCQTDITGDYITGLEKENTSLKEKLKMSSLNEDTMRRFFFLYSVIFILGKSRSFGKKAKDFRLK